MIQILVTAYNRVFEIKDQLADQMDVVQAILSKRLNPAYDLTAVINKENIRYDREAGVLYISDSRLCETSLPVSSELLGLDP